jgi:hypothetical protein
MMLKERVEDSQGTRQSVFCAGGTGQAQLDDTRSSDLSGIWAPILAAIALVASPIARQWIASAAANVCILGGIIAAPVISIVAWVGMILPTKAPLHQMAPSLMTGALIWLALAIIGAHAFRVDRREGAK